MKIEKIEALFVNVSEKSNWTFFRIVTDQGLSGLGEATLQGWEEVQLACLNRLLPQLTGATLDQAMPLITVYPHAFGGLAANSVLSALELAIMDIRAQAAGKPVHALLGKQLRDKVRVYATSIAALPIAPSKVMRIRRVKWRGAASPRSRFPRSTA